MSKKILVSLLEKLELGEKVVLATILDTKGSSPRHKGSKMLLGKNGVLAGTTGGGQGEAAVIKAGLELLKTGGFTTVEVEMFGEDVLLGKMICGGQNKVFLKKIEQEDRVFFQEALAKVNKGQEARYGIDEQTGEITLETGSFQDSFRPPEKLLILGGGYVGYALYQASLFLDFEITVFDDREEFANAKRFPRAIVQAGEFKELLKKYCFTKETYVVVLTRGHRGDYDCLSEVLNKPHAYLGCIGSKRKISLVNEQLIEDGFSQEQVASIFAPIGLDIGGETPEEISISILGQIIGVKHGKSL